MPNRILTAACCIALALAAHPAAAEVVAKSDSGFVSRNTAEVEATPSEAWQAWLAPARWWNKDHTYSGDSANLWIDAQAGGCFCEKLPAAKDAAPSARPGSIEHMRVIYADPGRVMRLSGGLGPLQSEAVTATLTMTFKPVPGGTRILWEYVVGGYMRYKAEEIGPLVDKVMAEQLARLGAQLGPLGLTARPADGDTKPGKPPASGKPAKPGTPAKP